MRNRNDVLHALRHADLDDLGGRLLAYADYRELAQPHAAVTRAIHDAAHGKHRHLYGLNLSLFDFLCYVIEGCVPMAEERKATTDAAAALPAVTGRRKD